MEYGSLINYVIGDRSKESFTPNDPCIEPGLECTELCYSDRHPWNVTEVVRDKKGIVKSITVQSCSVTADKTKPAAIGHQDWIIRPNPNGRKVILKWRKSKNGWYSKGYDGKGWGSRFAMGYAEEYYDWSF